MLVARSPYFKAMFTNKTIELETGVAKVKEYKAAVVQKVIEFMYTDKVEKLDFWSRSLLPAADYFQLPVLQASLPTLLPFFIRFQEACIESIVSTVTVQSALEDLRLAFTLKHINGFNERVLEFAKKHAKEIYESPEWTDEFMHENLEIVREFITFAFP